MSRFQTARLNAFVVNRRAIELLMRYAAEQGLIPHAYRADELFVT